MEQTYKFNAFISYSHRDIHAAKRLQSMLESYNLPASLRQQVKDAPKRFKVFRDSDELTSGILSEELRKKLDVSKFLIVICSPNSAQSEYVGDEIAYFRSLGRERNIIPLVIEGGGENTHTDVHECMHRQLMFGGLELLAIDIQSEKGFCYPLRFHKSVIRIIAKMLDLDFSVLWNKRKHKLIHQIIWLTILVTAILSTIVYFARKAQQEKAFDRMIILNEAGVQTSLPLSSNDSDYISVHFSENDVRSFSINSLFDTIFVNNIPGSFRNTPLRVECHAFGCIPIDTFLSFAADIQLPVARNPETFGRIRHYVFEKDVITPVAGAVFDFGCITAHTDKTGLLDVLIPLEFQKPSDYEVRITYDGKERQVAWKPTLNPFLDRTEIAKICLE